MSEVMMRFIYDRNKDGKVDSIDEDVIKRIVSDMVGVSAYENVMVIFDPARLVDVISGKVVNGGIYFDNSEFKVTGGTATASGATWVYYSLGGARKVRVSCYMCNYAASGGQSYIDFVKGDVDQVSGSGTSQYRVYIDIGQTTEDFRLDKDVDGTVTNLGYEAVDLTDGRFYKIDVNVNCVDGTIVVKRNNVQKFFVQDTDIDEIDYVRLLYNDTSTTAALSGAWACPVVITWE